MRRRRRSHTSHRCIMDPFRASEHLRRRRRRRLQQEQLPQWQRRLKWEIVVFGILAKYLPLFSSPPILLPNTEDGVITWHDTCSHSYLHSVTGIFDADRRRGAICLTLGAFLHQTIQIEKAATSKRDFQRSKECSVVAALPSSSQPGICVRPSL